MKEIKEKRLSYLYEAVQLGTVRAAADKLNVAPSAVSRQISMLEEELATTLIERNRKGVRPTEAGQILLKFFREAMSHEQDCITQLQALSGLQHGRIDLAVGEGFVGDLMSEPLPEFHRLYPALTLNIQTGSTNDVIRRVEEDEAHIGLVFHPPSHPSLRSQVISTQPICAITLPDHPLAQLNRTLMLNEAIIDEIALPESYFGVRQLLAMAEFKERLRLKPQLISNSIAVLKNYVLSGMGITYLPAFVVAKEIQQGQLCAIAIDHPLLAAGEAHILTRQGRQLSAGPHRLLQHLTQWMRAFNNIR